MVRSIRPTELRIVHPTRRRRSRPISRSAGARSRWTRRRSSRFALGKDNLLDALEAVRAGDRARARGLRERRDPGGGAGFAARLPVPPCRPDPPEGGAAARAQHRRHRRPRRRRGGPARRRGRAPADPGANRGARVRLGGARRHRSGPSTTRRRWRRRRRARSTSTWTRRPRTGCRRSGPKRVCGSRSTSSRRRSATSPGRCSTRSVASRLGPARSCMVVLPEFVVSKWRHLLLHNQNALFVKRLFLFEPNVVLSSVPYVISAGDAGGGPGRADGSRGRRRALPREVPEGDHGPTPDLGRGRDARARPAVRAGRGALGPDGPVPRPGPGPHGRRRRQPRPSRRRVAPRGRRGRARDQRRARARLRGVPHRPDEQGRRARRRRGRAARRGGARPARTELGHEGLVAQEEAEGEGVRARGQPRARSRASKRASGSPSTSSSRSRSRGCSWWRPRSVCSARARGDGVGAPRRLVAPDRRAHRVRGADRPIGCSGSSSRSGPEC